MSRAPLVLLLILSTAFVAFAQQDSVATESVVIKKKKQKKSHKKDFSYLDPKKATLFSIFPGGGQIYNQRYWKLPLVWGGLGVTIWQVVEQGNRYIYYRDAVNFVANPDNGTTTIIDKYTNRELAESQLREAKNYHQRQRDFFTIITAGIYVLQMIDASVDAHLLKFHDSENFLSLTPKILRVNQRDNVGLALTLHLK